jgi:hypothetical protein
MHRDDEDVESGEPSAEPTQELESMETRHIEIEKDAIYDVRLKGGDELVGAASRSHNLIWVPQRPAEGLAHKPMAIGQCESQRPRSWRHR